MAQPREQDRQATAKRSRSAKAGAARSASSGQFLRVHADDDVTEIPVSKLRYGRIVNKSRVLGKVIAGYADAAAKAKRTGKAYVITYVVTPDGKAQAMAEARAETRAEPRPPGSFGLGWGVAPRFVLGFG